MAGPIVPSKFLVPRTDREERGRERLVGDATGGLSSSEMEVYEAQGTKYYKDSELN
jgi:hypothetical protein